MPKYIINDVSVETMFAMEIPDGRLDHANDILEVLQKTDPQARFATWEEYNEVQRTMALMDGKDGV